MPHAHGAQGGLVDDVGQIRARRAHRGAGDGGVIDILGRGDITGMHAQHSLAAAKIGQIHRDAAVKAAGAQQGGVQNLRTVGSAQHHNTLGGVKAVHLGQQLVERLLTLIVGGQTHRVALLADSVDFINKDDARSLFIGLLEQIAHAGRARAYEHFNKG